MKGRITFPKIIKIHPTMKNISRSHIVCIINQTKLEKIEHTHSFKNW